MNINPENVIQEVRQGDTYVMFLDSYGYKELMTAVVIDADSFDPTDPSFICDVLVLDSEGLLESKAFLELMDKVGPEYCDAVKLARSIYEDTRKKEDLQLFSLPIVVIPRYYSKDRDKGVDMCITAAKAATNVNNGLRGQYAAVAINVTPCHDESLCNFWDSGLEDAQKIFDTDFEKAEGLGFEKFHDDPSIYTISRYVVKNMVKPEESKPQIYKNVTDTLSVYDATLIDFEESQALPGKGRFGATREWWVNNVSGKNTVLDANTGRAASRGAGGELFSLFATKPLAVRPALVCNAAEIGLEPEEDFIYKGRSYFVCPFTRNGKSVALMSDVLKNDKGEPILTPYKACLIKEIRSEDGSVHYIASDRNGDTLNWESVRGYKDSDVKQFVDKWAKADSIIQDKEKAS